VRSADRDRTGRTWAALIAAGTAVGLAAAGAVVADGWAPAVAVVAYLGPIAVATVFGVIAVASLVKSLHRQLLLAGAVTVAGLAATIALSVEAMYVSQHDALLTVLLAAYGLVIGSWSATRRQAAAWSSAPSSATDTIPILSAGRQLPRARRLSG
jgi:hypothetical protein